MMDPTEDFERRRLQQRLVELRNQIHEISGGEAQFGPAGEDLSLEQEGAFLEHLISIETAPRTTWLNRLRSAGYEMPDADNPPRGRPTPGRGGPRGATVIATFDRPDRRARTGPPRHCPR